MTPVPKTTPEPTRSIDSIYGDEPGHPRSWDNLQVAERLLNVAVGVQPTVSRATEETGVA